MSSPRHLSSRDITAIVTSIDKLTRLSQVFASDANAAFSTSIGWNHGERTARYAIVIDHGKVVYAEKETELQGLEVSGAEPVLKAL